MRKFSDDLIAIATEGEQLRLAKLQAAIAAGRDATHKADRLYRRLYHRRLRGSEARASVEIEESAEEGREACVAMMTTHTVIATVSAIRRGDRTIALGPGVEALVANGVVVTLSFGINGLITAVALESGADGQVIKKEASAQQHAAIDEAIRARLHREIESENDTA